MSQTSSGQIATVMQEGRTFPPSAGVFFQGTYQDDGGVPEAVGTRLRPIPEAFWGELAKEELHWFKPFTKTLEWNEPFAKWFVGGQTNASYNCLDAHLSRPQADQPAIIWEGEPVATS